MRDVYPPTHWAIRGVPPAYDTPDEDVYLAGRNLVLLTKAGVVAAKARAHRIALGPLAGNPFPDARPAFFSAMAQRAVARPRSSDRNRDAVSHLGKGGRDQTRRRARRAVRADAVVHESGAESPTGCRSTADCAASAANGVMRSRPPACQTRAPTRTERQVEQRFQGSTVPEVPWFGSTVQVPGSVSV